MSNLTWAQWLSIASLVISLAALFINFSKFFIDLHDRKEKRNKEAEEAKEKLKGKFSATIVGKDIVIENKSTVDVNIKEIYADGEPWDESGYFIVDRPSLFTAGQSKTFRVLISKDNPYPSVIMIEFADPYSRKYLTETRKIEFEL